MTAASEPAGRGVSGVERSRPAPTTATATAVRPAYDTGARPYPPRGPLHATR
ncbi:MAG: hypothetical protein ACJ73S_29300 [Mycobacteriales bacterium]